MQQDLERTPAASGLRGQSRRQLVTALAAATLAAGRGAPSSPARKRKRRKKGAGKTRRVTRTFVSDGQIRIPGPVNGIGPASPYPSSIVVSGFKGGVVRHVAVTINGLTHVTGDEVLVMLAKDTINAVLMVRTGGKIAVPNVTLTFDDLAATTLPLTTALASGSFQPTMNDVSANLPFYFPAPAPVPGGNTLLSAFQGTDPNGSWRLYAADRVLAADGEITGGWEVTITADVPKKRKKKRKKR